MVNPLDVKIQLSYLYRYYRMEVPIITRILLPSLGCAPYLWTPGYFLDNAPECLAMLQRAGDLIEIWHE